MVVKSAKGRISARHECARHNKSNIVVDRPHIRREYERRSPQNATDRYGYSWCGLTCAQSFSEALSSAQPEWSTANRTPLSIAEFPSPTVCASTWPELWSTPKPKDGLPVVTDTPAERLQIRGSSFAERVYTTAAAFQVIRGQLSAGQR